MKLTDLIENFDAMWAAYEAKAKTLVDKTGDVEKGMDQSTTTAEWRKLFDMHDSVKLEDKVNDLHQRLKKK